MEDTDNVKTQSGPRNGGVAASLTIQQASMDDTGEVKAVAKNVAGEATSVAKLNVVSKYVNVHFILS